MGRTGRLGISSHVASGLVGVVAVCTLLSLISSKLPNNTDSYTNGCHFLIHCS